MKDFPQMMLGETIRAALDKAVAEHGWVKVQFLTNDPNSLEINCDGFIADFAILPVAMPAEAEAPTPNKEERSSSAQPRTSPPSPQQRRSEP